MEIKRLIESKKEFRELFSEFSEEDISHLEAVTFPPDSTIIKKDSPTSYIYYIVSGICGVMQEFDNGQEFCNYKISSYDTIGISEILSKEKTRIANVIALTTVVAIKISAEDFLIWKVNYQDFYDKIICTIIQRLHLDGRSAAEYKCYDSHTNLVTYLMYCYKLYLRTYEDDYMGPVKINETKEIISNAVSISLRSTYKSLEQLKTAGIIDINRGKIYISYQQYEALSKYKMDRLL